MNNVITCSAEDNPYLNNFDARETASSQHVIEGRLYTKLSYVLTVHGKFIKIIQVIALVILTGFIALSFKKVLKRLWAQGFKRLENITVLTHQGLFVGTRVAGDIEKLVLSYLSVKDVQALCVTSRSNQKKAKSEMIERLNRGEIAPKDLGLKTVSQVIAFFGARCSEIWRLDIKAFRGINDGDIEKIAASFTNLQYLTVSGPHLTNGSVRSFSKFVSLKSFYLFPSKGLSDFSFIQHWPQLEKLDLTGCFKLKNIDFLRHCKLLKVLNLLGCCKLSDIGPLQYCPSLQYIKLIGCWNIVDYSPLQNCLKLIHFDGLRLSSTSRNEDFKFLERCSKLANLGISWGSGHQQDLKFLQYCSSIASLSLMAREPVSNSDFLQFCPNLTSLDLQESISTNDLIILRHCQNLTSLSLKNCTVADITSLQHCPELININLSGAGLLVDINPLQYCTKLQNLDLSRCIAIQDFQSLESCTKLKTVKLMGCQRIDNSVLETLRLRSVQVTV